jgi:hypothetical protein
MSHIPSRRGPARCGAGPGEGRTPGRRATLAPPAGSRTRDHSPESRSPADCTIRPSGRAIEARAAHAGSIARMNSTQDIVDSIDTRLRKLSEEINTLNAARSALDGRERQSSTEPSRRAGRKRPAGRRPTPRPRASVRSRHETSREVTHESIGRSRERAPKTARPKTRRASRATLAEHLESLLSDNGGLTTADLAERASGNRDHVLKLLRDMETAGRVRRTGQRRSTRWHAITDEDRIRQRIAELEATRRNRA